MSRHPFFERLPALVFTAVFSLAALTAPAASAQSPEPPAGLDSKALWLAEGEELVGLDPASLAAELAIAAGRARAVAVDPKRRRVWLHTGDRLEAFDFTGEPVAGFTLSEDSRRGRGLGRHRFGFGFGLGLGLLPRLGGAEDSHLTVEPESGDLYLAEDETVRRLSSDGAARFRVELRRDIEDIALDLEREQLWLVTERGAVRAIDAAGNVTEPLPRARRRRARALAYDGEQDAFWLALRRSVVRVGPDGAQQASVPIRHVQALDADGAGGVWAIGRFRLVHITAAGELDVEAFPGLRGRLVGTLDHLSADPSDGSVWVANRLRAAHFAADGTLIAVQDRERGRGLPDFLNEVVLYADVRAPALEFLGPDPERWLADKRPTLALRASRDADPDTLAVTAAGEDLPVGCQPANADSGAGGGADPRPLTKDTDCTPERDLPEGEVDLEASIEDFAGNRSEPAEHTVRIDTVPPEIMVDSLEAGLITNEPEQTLAGRISEPAELTVNGNSVAVGDDTNQFSRSITLEEGANPFTLTAVDRAGNETDTTLTATLDTEPPAAVNAEAVTIELDGDEAVVRAGPGSVEPGAEVVITNTRTGERVRVQAASDGSFQARIAARAGDRLQITVEDAAGNTSEETELDAGADGPPDPADVAPPLSETGVTPFDEAVEFLFTGSNPIQTGVAEGTIEPRRAAVLRGRVITRDGAPLSGVKVTILDHPELGETRTRADGRFDLAVNGGGSLTLVYERDGFLSAQRTVQAPWNDYAFAPDVALIPLSEQATTVNLASGAPMQAARGPIESDADGERRATLLFPEGTTATITTAEGEQKQLTELTVRATEYTVGANGPEAMPAELPPQSGYTYAVELSVDEARAQGVKIAGKDVVFNQEIPLYVDNFLDFPTGEPVPVGFYDNDAAAWEAVDNGRIIEILSEAGGQAVIDVTGDGEPATADELAELGINDAELARLAELQDPGDSLWRTPIGHLSTWDCNWPFGPPADAEAPPREAAETPDEDRTEDSDDENGCDGCVISPQGQTVGEEIDLTGTPYSLHYRSDRVAGRTAGNTVTVPVSDDTVPGSLEEIEVSVEVAGRRLRREPEPLGGLSETFEWDGRDAYGRAVFGTETATVTVKYVYGCIYRPGDNGFALFASSADAIGSRTDCEGFSFSQRSQVQLRSPFEPPVNAIGNWSVNVHHALEGGRGRLLRGDGGHREALGATIDTVAGTDQRGFSGDGGPASEAQLAFPQDLAFGADGSLYVADLRNNRIRRVRPNGTIDTVAGNGDPGFSGDAGPAREARLDRPQGVALGPDDSIYIADTINNRIRRVTPDGIIDTVAGGGNGGLGDGGPASQAQLDRPRGIAVGPDGSVYIADTDHDRIRRVGPDGVIHTVAGGGDNDPGDGGLARQTRLDRPRGIAIGPDGSLYIADNLNDRVRRVGSDGMIETVAGSEQTGFAGDGGPAREASLSRPRGIAVGPDGSLYIADTSNNRIRRVGVNGAIHTVAGRDRGFAGDGGPATEARLDRPLEVAFGADGDLYIADTLNHRVRRIRSVGLALTSTGGRRVASRDGTRVFVFDRAGRHLRTENARTGAIQHQFSRDSEGRLIAITDGDGNVTTIERGPNGRATAIIAPDGQRTGLAVDDNGHLTEVTNPAGERHRIAYTDGGLMTRFTDRRGLTTEFEYDELGRLIRDTNAGGGGWTIAREELDAGYRTRMTTAEGRELSFSVEPQATGERIQRNVQADGTVQQKRIGPGGDTITSPDGTVTEIEEGPDPRFGLDAPVAERTTVTLPSGLEQVIERSRTAELAEPDALTEPDRLTRTVTVNGRTTETVYDGASRTFTATTPEGRQSTTEIDGQGRPLRSQLGPLAATEQQYDARGRLTQIVRGRGADSRSTQLAYHDSGAQAGFLASITDPLGRQTEFTYDAAGRVTEQTLPDGRTVGFQYDGNGNVAAVTPPGRTAHVFKYNDLDERSAYEPPELDGIDTVTTFQYNRDRQLTRIERPGGETVAFAYDSGGRLAEQSAPVGSWQFGYEADTGQLANIDAPGGVGLAFTWDGFLPVSTTWTGPVSGTVERSFDENFFVTQRSVNGNAIAFGYDDDGLLTAAGALALERSPEVGLVTGTTLASITGSRGYNDFAELTQRAVDNAGDTAYDVSYVRDELGRITQETETIDGERHTFRYRYDEAGRLTEVSRDGSVRHTYSYDENGNRLEHVGPNGTETGSYDDQDRLTTYAGQSYSYTANGELTEKTGPQGTTTYDYDVLGNLREVELPDGRTIEYVIDGRNRRVGKRVDGTLVQGFLYKDQLNPVAELDGSGNVEARFVYGDKPNVPAYMIKDGTTYRIVSDHLGSVRLVINTSTGEIAQRMDYSPFGRVVVDTNPGFQPFGFAGGIYDPDTGLVRFGARDYDPEIGRWTMKDPILFAGGSTNLYGYVLNDPVNTLDPNGQAIRPIPRIILRTGRGARPVEQQIREQLSRQMGEPQTVRPEIRVPPPGSRQLPPQNFGRQDFFNSLSRALGRILKELRDEVGGGFGTLPPIAPLQSGQLGCSNNSPSFDEEACLRSPFCV